MYTFPLVFWLEKRKFSQQFSDAEMLKVQCSLLPWKSQSVPFKSNEAVKHFGRFF